jgi:hypothetical protein
MSRIYATREDTGEKFLLALKCDRCGAEIKPNPDISQSGWMKRGWDNGVVKSAIDLCPDCAWEEL